MRRTFATYFPGEDVDCQRILGHTDIKTTMKYRRSRDGRTREAVNRLDYGLSTAPAQGEHTHSTHATGNG